MVEPDTMPGQNTFIAGFTQCKPVQALFAMRKL